VASDLLQPNLLQGLLRACQHLVARQRSGPQSVGHVVEHRLVVVEQRVVLEHHADVALVGRHGGDVVVVEEDAARVGFIEAGDATQQRRLAAGSKGSQQSRTR